MEKQHISKYWACPFCNTIIPKFRHYPDMWKKRIENHLRKCHLGDLNGSNGRIYFKEQNLIER